MGRKYTAEIAIGKPPRKILAQIRAVHPNRLFLLADVVAHEGVGAFVASLACQLKQRTLTEQQNTKCRDAMLEGFGTVGDVLHRMQNKGYQ